MIRIGSASISETGTKTGKAGDQTGKEVYIRKWYNSLWLAVYRHPDAKIREEIARRCEEACNNNNIGYSQNDRYSLFRQIEKGKTFDNAEKCNCDCSSLVMAILKSLGINVSFYLTTGNMNIQLIKNGFQKFVNEKYLSSFEHLKRGDILLRKGHVVIVLDDGMKEEINAGVEFTRLLKIRCRGEDVADLQRRLNVLGYGLVVDGIFGKKTQNAVKDLQRQKGLVQDGIVGPITSKYI